MTTTTDVENYPGFAEIIQGPWLMDQMRVQAEHVGTEIVADISSPWIFSASPSGSRATAATNTPPTP